MSNDSTAVLVFSCDRTFWNCIDKLGPYKIKKYTFLKNKQKKQQIKIALGVNESV